MMSVTLSESSPPESSPPNRDGPEEGLLFASQKIVHKDFIIFKTRTILILVVCFVPTGELCINDARF